MGKSTTHAIEHEALAVVLQVRRGQLQVLLWERARSPFQGSWGLPGGLLGARETLEASIQRHLAAKVDVRELSHLEQLETLSDPKRHPERRLIATAYLGLVPAGIDPKIPADTTWHPVDELPELAFDHLTAVLAGRERLRAKLSYTNIGFALAPPAFTIAELRAVDPRFDESAVSETDVSRSLASRSSPGGTAPERVRAAIEEARTALLA